MQIDSPLENKKLGYFIDYLWHLKTKKFNFPLNMSTFRNISWPDSVGKKLVIKFEVEERRRQK